MDRVDVYDHAGLVATRGGKMFSTHVGDDFQWAGFGEGANPPGAGSLNARAHHPVFEPSMQLVGFIFLVLLILYMDKRIKVPLLP